MEAKGRLQRATVAVQATRRGGPCCAPVSLRGELSHRLFLRAAFQLEDGGASATKAARFSNMSIPHTPALFPSAAYNSDAHQTQKNSHNV